jgi:uncharacterized membrane protein
MSRVLSFFDTVIEPNVRRKPVTARLPFVIELLVLSGCLIVSLLLVLAHFGAVALPGCSTASGCTQAAETRWGKLPGTEWPLSFLGFAFFQGVVAAFICNRGRLPLWLRAIVGFGAIISMLLTAVMFRGGYVCSYCLAIHILNITVRVVPTAGAR